MGSRFSSFSLGRAGEVLRAVHKNRMADLSAQLAYWALLALFPSVIFMLTVIGYLPLEGLDRVLLREIYRVMPSEAAQLVDHTIHEVIGRQRGWLLVLALFGTLWSGSRSIGGLVRALNRAHGVEETRSFVQLTVLTAAAALGAALLYIAAMAALLIGPSLVYTVFGFFGLRSHFHLVWAWIRWPTSALAMLSLLSCVYCFLPNVALRFRLFSAGSATALLLWAAESLLLRLYVTRFHAFARTYGTLGTAIVLMTWLQLSALSVLIGAEVDAARARAAANRA
jgi:membrane protein